MDARVFGSTYPFVGTLPFASGHVHFPTDDGSNRKDFASCRAIFIESVVGGGGQEGGYLAVEMADAPGQSIRIEELKGDTILPISCTAVISGDVTEVLLLY